jgi:hypothetical protein
MRGLAGNEFKSAAAKIWNNLTKAQRFNRPEVSNNRRRSAELFAKSAQRYRWLHSGERDADALVVFIEGAARNDFAIEALESMPSRRAAAASAAVEAFRLILLGR